MKQFDGRIKRFSRPEKNIKGVVTTPLGRRGLNGSQLVKIKKNIPAMKFTGMKQLV